MVAKASSVLPCDQSDLIEAVDDIGAEAGPCDCEWECHGCGHPPLRFMMDGRQPPDGNFHESGTPTMTANIPKKPKPSSELDLSGLDRWLSAAMRSKPGADASANHGIGKAKRGAAKRYPPSAVVPILTKLGIRVRQVSVDCVDLLVEGVPELRRLQELAVEIACRRRLYCELEIVTDEVYHQGDDQWRVEVLFARADKKPIRTADYRWAAKRIREWASDQKLLLDE